MRSSPPPVYPPGLKPPPADDLYVEEINDDLYVEADLAALEAELPPPMYDDDEKMDVEGALIIHEGKEDESTEDEDSGLDESDEDEEDNESLQIREQELMVIYLYELYCLQCCI